MVVLVASTFLAFEPVLHAGFVNLDDNVYVTENPIVRGGLTAQSLRWAFLQSYDGHWHPLAWLSHMLDVDLYGLEPAGHHLTSLYLHLANGVLLFLVLRGMTGAVWRSALVAGLFALHPLRVESVAWVAERKDVLSAFFGLLALAAYAAHAARPSIGRLAAVTLCFALALLAKPMLVTLPFVLLLLDRWPLAARRPATRGLLTEKLPLIALSGAVAAITVIVAVRSGAADVAVLPFRVRLANALVAHARYLGKIAWPVDLAVFYPLPGAWGPWVVTGAGIALAATGGLAVATGRRHPYLLVGWLWFVLMLLPVSGLIQAGSQAMADRCTYLPSIGVFLALTWGVADLLGRWPARRHVVATAGVLVLLGLGLLTRRQAGYWTDNVTLFTHALDVTTDNWLAHNNLGDALAKRGATEPAIAHFREALRLKPDYAQAEFNLGFALAVEGRTDEAVEHYAAALALDPEYADAYNNLGVVLLAQGKADQAVESLLRAVEVRPDFAEAHFNLGIALNRAQGVCDEAVAQYADAVRLKPDFAEAEYNLALNLRAEGRTAEAQRHLEAAARLRPELARRAAGPPVP